MSDTVKVRTLKGFNDGHRYVRRGTELEVSETRARELERNGLVTREAKKAAEPANKKAPEPKNKAAAGAKTKAD